MKNKSVVLSILGFMALLIGLFVSKLQSGPPVLSNEELQRLGAFQFPVPRELSEFQLTDNKQQAFDLERLKGKWTLVTYGYTYCPDVCPTTLALLSKVTKELGKNNGGVDETQYLFVSADPERDSVERLDEYVTFFSPEFLGATSDFDSLRQLAQQLNIAFVKVPGEDPDSYLVDHTANIAVINPNGHYHGYIRHPFAMNNLIKSFSSMVKDFSG